MHPDRFYAKTRRNELTDCLEWTGSKINDGYGRVGFNGKLYLAHRQAYEFFFGEIPETIELDHLCKNRACVNPLHLDPVTHAENVKRGESGRNSRRKTHCPRRHEYSKENTMISGGKRYCRVCRRDSLVRRLSQ